MTDMSWMDLTRGAYPMVPVPSVHPYRWKLPIGIDHTNCDVDVTLSLYGQVRLLAPGCAESVTPVMRAMAAWVLAAGGRVSVLCGNKEAYEDLASPGLHLFPDGLSFWFHLSALEGMRQPVDGPDVPHLLVVDKAIDPVEHPELWRSLRSLVVEEPYVAVTREEDRPRAAYELHEHGPRIVIGPVGFWHRLRFQGVSPVASWAPPRHGDAVMTTPRAPMGMPVWLFSLPVGLGSLYLASAAHKQQEEPNRRAE